jgi:hypothetical protein
VKADLFVDRASALERSREWRREFDDAASE